MSRESSIPFWKSLSVEERIQVKMLLRFLGFIVMTIFAIGILIALVTSGMYTG